MEIFSPDGLRRYGDGWKLSARIRFVHARVRNLLEKSNDWNAAAWGKPISAAHLGYAIAVFSVRLLSFSERLGVVLSEDERNSNSRQIRNRSPNGPDQAPGRPESG